MVELGKWSVVDALVGDYVNVLIYDMNFWIKLMWWCFMAYWLELGTCVIMENV